MMAVAMANVAPVRSGAASGVVNTARMIGATLGVAVLGAVFAAHTGQQVRDAAQFMTGFRAALLGAGVVLLFGAVVAYGFIRRESGKESADGWKGETAGVGAKSEGKEGAEARAA